MGCTSSSERVVQKHSEPTANVAKYSQPGTGQQVVKPIQKIIVNGKEVGSHSQVSLTSTSRSVENTQKCAFGAGCYWGTEKFIKHDFSKRFAHLGSIVSGTVGFMGPPNAKANPTYMEVCSGNTGHVEIFHVEYTGGQPFFEAMVRFFFQFHDPTTENRQGNDRGSQYASVIYCESEEQVRIAQKVKMELQSLVEKNKILGYQGRVVCTSITPYTSFYPAHEEHQDYLRKNPNGYCNHRIRFENWP